MQSTNRKPGQPSMYRPARLHAWHALGASLAFSLVGCAAHHTADEVVLDSEGNPIEETDSSSSAAQTSATKASATKATGGTSTGSTATTADPCANVADTDVMAQITCDMQNNTTGKLATPSNSQCSKADPNDLVTQGLCLIGTLTGSQTSSTAQGGLDLTTILKLVGGLTGSGTTTGASGTTQNNGLGSLLGLLGALGGTPTGTKTGNQGTATQSTAGQDILGTILAGFLGGGQGQQPTQAK
jgi:hypothetical protein